MGVVSMAFSTPHFPYFPDSNFQVILNSGSGFGYMDPKPKPETSFHAPPLLKPCKGGDFLSKSLSFPLCEQVIHKICGLRFVQVKERILLYY